MGSDLYNHLIKYFVNHLQSLRDVSIKYFTRDLPWLTLRVLLGL